MQSSIRFLSTCLLTVLLTSTLPDAAAEPVEVPLGEAAAGFHDRETIQVRGWLRDVFDDELDPHYLFMVLNDGADTLYLVTDERDNADTFRSLIGSEILVRGYCNSYRIGSRTLMGSRLSASLDHITLLHRAPHDPYDVPDLFADRDKLQVNKITALGRRRAIGRVLAVWQQRNVLLRTQGGDVVRAELQDDELPRVDASVEIVGTAETDLHRLNLSSARWRETAAEVPPEPAPERVTAEFLLTDGTGRQMIKHQWHGRAIRLEGVLRSDTGLTDVNGRMVLECGSFLISVDTSACPEARAGLRRNARLEVTGICLMELRNWRPQEPFPRIEGFSVIVRSPDDIRVLARPPWLTPLHLLIASATLLTAFLVVLVWNLSLRRRAERRGRELYDERIAREKSQLKVEERTRLAVELHDTISQNLTGISMQIDSAGNYIGEDPEKALQHLAYASRTLVSCRKELRNCIWDLKNLTLDEPDMNAAVRKVLPPVPEGVRVQIRFNVPRATLPDDTVHTIVYAVRELAANALRHGHAKNVRIAGTTEGNRILFSVTDDGCGFDPDERPGFAEGHFGLQGITERIRRLHGRMTVDSAPGKGCHVAIALERTGDEPA